MSVDSDHARARWLFLRFLATMVSAGIPIVQALETCEKQSDRGKYSKLARDVTVSIENGMRISEAFRLHPWFFSSFHCHLIAVAEQTGSLSLVLAKLADYEEKSLGLKREMVSKLTYPTILFCVSVVGLVFLPMFALEGLFKVLENSGVELPILTVVFMNVSRFLSSPAGVSILLVCGLSFLLLLKAWQKDSIRQQQFLSLVLATPVLGEVFRVSDVARFAFSLGLQLEVGISPLDSLRIAAENCQSSEISGQMKDAIAALKEGASLSQSLERIDLLDQVFISTVNIGEESGTVPRLLKQMGLYYEQELERSLEAMSAMLEPLVMCFMGVLFGGMILATMLPIVKLVQTL